MTRLVRLASAVPLALGLAAAVAAAGSFRQISTTPSETFLDVRFVDAKEGWVSSWGGGIFHSTDGGRSWKRQATGLEYEWVNELAVIDEDRLLACGGDGTVLATEDGGESWKPVYRARMGLEGIQTLAGGARAVAVGGSPLAGALVLLGEDGGRSWRETPLECPDLLMAVHFPDERTGYAVGVRGRTLKTTDGGATWASLAPGSDALLYAVRFADAATGWIAGRGSTILATTDGGASWRRQTTPEGYEFDGLACLDARRAWAVGGSVDPAKGSIVLATTDGGATWVRQEAPKRNWWEAVFFLRPDLGWVVGNTGAVLKSE